MLSSPGRRNFLSNSLRHLASARPPRAVLGRRSAKKEGSLFPPVALSGGLAFVISGRNEKAR